MAACSLVYHCRNPLFIEIVGVKSQTFSQILPHFLSLQRPRGGGGEILYKFCSHQIFYSYSNRGKLRNQDPRELALKLIEKVRRREMLGLFLHEGSLIWEQGGGQLVGKGGKGNGGSSSPLELKNGSRQT